MSDLIEKIGQFFAEQQAQIQHTHSLIHSEVQADARGTQAKSPAMHRIPHEVHASLSPALTRRVPASDTAEEPARVVSLLRRRLSFQDPMAVAVTASQCGSKNALCRSSTPRELPQKKLYPREPITAAASAPSHQHHHPEEKRVAWRYCRTDSLGSWRSSFTDVSSDRDDDLLSLSSSAPSERQRKPRPPRQKVRRRMRKKKSGSPGITSPENEEQILAEAETLVRANEEKVSAALALAKERARRIQQEKFQLARERKMEREQAEQRLQDQMTKIEAVRAKTLRTLPHITPNLTPRSMQSDSRSQRDDDTVNSVAMNDTKCEADDPAQPGTFLSRLELQLRQRMELEMNVKTKCLQSYQQREQLRAKLGRVLQRHATQQAKVQRLAATKAALENELASVLEEGAETRRDRRELEEAGKKERLRRQQEEERALHMRLREEEWANMMEEEKERSAVAAKARVKARNRVEARSADLRQKRQASWNKPLGSRGQDRVSRSNNNYSDGSGSDDASESDASSPRNNEVQDSSKPSRGFKLDFFLLPELAGFEEDGICTTDKSHSPSHAMALKMTGHRYDLGTQMHVRASKSDQKRSSCCMTSSRSVEGTIFIWEVPPFPSKTKFDRVLLEELVSDEESN